ncbi:hypothetical protein SAMN02745146_3291 [Hymenobacter daecheongensis DSM 21074]|uniref:SmpA / OmlA family protein n=1 Tax=Hymenobacter daecheongensis DSM 21074 TaxID=1121955 RepID=A0A1M6JW62_9BACT|nr:hypothetical protein [Hymenobacter daecheongensis]SHJ50941.1 hypothetical protein SAMN02745146_3291 [Hymenobacter daecheongensis DSM 21074]
MRHFFILIVLAALSSCGHSLSGIPGFDSAAWRQDVYACRNQRARQLPVLNAHRETLYGTRTADIDALFGQPDEEELTEQTEKTYFYYIEPGTQCEPRHQRSAANKLAIHFGPTGIVTAVLYERPLPQQ